MAAPSAGSVLESTPAGTGLAGLLTAAAGTGDRYAGLDDAGLVTAVRRWADEESWCHGRVLAAVRELIRRHPLAGREAKTAGGMPSAWQATLADEIALVLRSGQGSADKLAALAWTLEVRLPLTGAALDAGILNASLARMIADQTSVLSDEDARAAEAAVAGWWAGKTWAQLQRRLAAAVINIDPDGAAKRREDSERQAQVRMWRGRTGPPGLTASGPSSICSPGPTAAPTSPRPPPPPPAPRTGAPRTGAPRAVTARAAAGRT